MPRKPGAVRKPLTEDEKAKARVRARLWALANPERCRETQRTIYLRNREKRLAYVKAYAVTNRETVLEKARAYAAANRQEACIRAAAWKKANPARVNATNSRRRAAELQAAPKWLTKEHHAQMLNMYECARAFGCHVDHIIPLKGETVSGLHVPWNLQFLTPAENMSKKNRLVMKEAA